MGAALTLWRMEDAAPYARPVGEVHIDSRTLTAGETATLKIGRLEPMFTRKPGTDFAWANTGSRTFVGLPGAALPAVQADPGTAPEKLRLFGWSDVEYFSDGEGHALTNGSRTEVRYTVAALNLRQVNILLTRTQDSPVVTRYAEARDEGDALALNAPLTIYRAVPAKGETWQPWGQADARRGWARLRLAMGG